MQVLQNMAQLRPYIIQSNSLVYDLEAQLAAKSSTMKVADYLAFAQGTETYLRRKYGDESALPFLASKKHWTGLRCYMENMAALWEMLDTKTQDNLHLHPLQAVMDEKCCRNLPSGGAFEFE